MRLGRDFNALWAGQTISQFGSQITTLALPLTAVVVLNAGPAEMGLLSAAGYLPALLLTLLAGVWIDRRTRRPILVGADLGRALITALVPLAVLAGYLRMEPLYVIAMAAGVLTVLFDTAYHAYVPSLVDPRMLIKANSRLQLSGSVAALAGPGLGGILVQVFTAPTALLLDVASFLLSGLALMGVRARESEPEPAVRDLRAEIREGLGATFGNRFLRPIAMEAATFNFFSQFIAALFVLHATHELRLSPAAIGGITATAAVGALVGSLVAERLSRWLGFGRALVASMILACSPMLLVPLANGPALLVTAFFLEGVGVAVSSVQAVSLRQVAVPARVLGRANAGYRTLTFGVLPLGAMAGGFLGAALGTWQALLVGAIGIALAPLWVVFSPVRGLAEPADAVAPDQRGANLSNAASDI